MRKIISLLSIILLFSHSASAQKKDSTVSYDTVYVFRANDIAAFKSILMNAKLAGEDGQPFSGNQIIQLMNWIDSRRTLIPKQQPKK